MFEIIPAIDILGGKCVRLSQGKFDRVKVYNEDPTSVAKTFEDLGAPRLHVIDLDGAKAGKIKNIGAIKKIISAIQIPVEVGGGIRNFDDIQTLINAGVDRVIIGTTAITKPEFVESLCKKYKKRIIVGVDSKERQVAIEGWEKLSLKDTLAFTKELVNLGVKRIIYTDIKRDGMLKGPNFDTIKELAREVKISIIASGGITTIDDIKKLKKIRRVDGAIIGKAIYEGKIKLGEALRV